MIQKLARLSFWGLGTAIYSSLPLLLMNLLLLGQGRQMCTKIMLHLEENF
jgi:hypothetical protein